MITIVTLYYCHIILSHYITIIMIFCHHHHYCQRRGRGDSSSPISPCYVSRHNIVNANTIYGQPPPACTIKTILKVSSMWQLAGGKGSKGDGSVAADGRHLQVFTLSYHQINVSYLITILWSPSHIILYHYTFFHDHYSIAIKIMNMMIMTMIVLCVFRQNPKFGDAAKFQGELEAAILRVQVDHHNHDQPSEYRLTIYRYAIIRSFSKYR